MSKKYAARDGRDAAYPGATQEDADRLNPYKQADRKKAWNAESNAREWDEAFMKAAHTLTQEADDAAAHEDGFERFMARGEEDRWRAVFDFLCERGYEL